jgi:type II secretory pathway pseudopilin PulG
MKKIVAITKAKFIRSHEKGFSPAFTLLETIVAVALLVIALMGPVALATFSLQRAKYGKDQLIAYFLAEEAMEYIKNKRDSDGFSSLSSLGCDSGCTIDVWSGSVQQCSGNNGCPVLKFDKNTGKYGYMSDHDSVVGTKFVRTVTVDEINSNVEATVLVTISGPEKEFTLEEHIFNWQ